ncbi:hypothetical protein RJT34_33057 [Clitoria ternatea]|uniref:F-box/LRR-repeat protein 15-like leucin rich repeat domain-containing protein n=1 Tax=Clitoria ternatea TaxID=43366 RepID=A0AAN9EXL0_CLITE
MLPTNPKPKSLISISNPDQNPSPSSIPNSPNQTQNSPNTHAILPNAQSPTHGSTSNTAPPLKREIHDTIDFFNPIDGNAVASAKRTRFNDHDFDAVQSQNPHSQTNTQEEIARRPPLPAEIDFLNNAFREAQLAVNDHDNFDFDREFHHDNNRRYGQLYWEEYRRNQRMKRFRKTAKENASRFAHFEHHVGGDNGQSFVSQRDERIGDYSTPFAAALEAIKRRAVKGFAPASVTSLSTGDGEGKGERFLVPSLQELCLKILADNADAVVSLEGVPDELRHRLSQLLCDSRKMNAHCFELLIRGSPTEIRLKDCSWMTEEQFAKSFQSCDTSRLEVLQLDQCGRCIPDYVFLATSTPMWLPRLTSLSLSGACRLSDKGLQALVSSAPALRSINLSQCCLLTSASLNILADSLGSLLKELYLDDCQIMDAMLILPALKKLEHLEVLSLAGIQTVSDEFIRDYIIALGHNMKELVLKDCIKLTDASIKVIAENCSRLCALDLMNLHKLTDLSVGYLANSCKTLDTLKLCRNPFSDEAIAALLEITGDSLKELSLNNIKKVGYHTTLSLARHGKKLHTLDLSWCRSLMDNELGLIVDSCFSLRLLKLFGCSLVTEDFLNGLSNPEIQVVGLKMSPLLQHVKVPDAHQGVLRYSSASANLIQVRN